MQELKPVAGAKALLQSLSLPRCTASNAPVEKTKRQLALTGLAEFFGDNLFSAYAVNAWKPDPALFLYAANAMGFEPRDCLVVEDSPVGVEAALAAGIPVVHYDPEDQFSAIAGVQKIEKLQLLGGLLR